MIGELTANGINIDLKQDEPFPFNYSIADMKDPQKRKRNYSRSVKLPGTQNNMDFFFAAYNLSISTVGGTSSVGFNFDPTVRIPATYKKNSVVVFKGLLQLNEVIIKGEDYTFECTLFSDFIELFLALGDLKVSELGWSEYDHALNRTNIKNSWNTSVMLNGVATSNFTAGLPQGFGYHYGLVDYGYTRPAPKTFRVTDIVPMVYWREVFIKCLALSGITYTSTFIDSALFRKLLLGFGGGEKQVISPAEISNRRTQFNGSYSHVITRTANTNTQGGNTTAQFSVYQQLNVIDQDTGFTPSVVTDIYQQYDSTDGQITVERTGNYKLHVTQTLNVDVDAGTMVGEQGRINVFLSVLRNGTFISASSGSFTGTDNFNIVFDKTLDLQLNAWDTIDIKINVQGSIKFALTGGPETLEPLVITLTDSPNFTFDLTSQQTTLGDGDLIELSRFIPDMKAADFAAAVIMAFNLYISDPDLFNVVTIEPLTTFYKPTNVFDDWTQLLDHKEEVIVKPSSSIEGKFYKFKFTEDSDYDNKRYRDRFGIGYGDYTYEVESTWQKGDRVYQLPFAQTIPTDALTPLIVPRIVSVDESTQVVKPFKGKPRIYIWNGLKTGAWRLSNVNTSSFEDLTTYPSVHHFDNFQNPTFDLNFGLPIELQYVTNVITNANMFNIYHRPFIQEITGRDSKIIEASFKLNSYLINKLDFGKLKMINGVLFRLNTISDFDDSKTESTKVELVKVIAANKPRTGRTIATTKPAQKKPLIISPGATLPGQSVPIVQVRRSPVNSSNKSAIIIRG